MKQAQTDSEQLTLIGNDAAIRAEAWDVFEKIKDQLIKSQMNYDIGQIVLEHRTPQKGQAYDTLKIMDQPCIHFKGKKQLSIEVAPKLVPIFERFGVSLKRTANGWGKARYTINLACQLHQPNLGPEIYEVFLYSGNDTFGCCSSYVQCSDAKACIKKDIMFSGRCAYRLNLKQGRIFYGKNNNYPSPL